ncbi:MAG TPA: phage terminase small subunit P27 family [Tepidisphaeraceae bacterium]|jgi:P27 family predicted phage terminase small subunit
MARPRTPTAILALRGSKHAKARQSEPQPTKAAPKCPDHLSDAAKVEWERMVRLLLPQGMLTVIDGDQLALYCQAYARWAEAERELATGGTVVKSPNGYPIQNPYLSVATTAMKQMAQYLPRFGMTPADRSRVRSNLPAEDSIEAFNRSFDINPLKLAK